MRFMRRRALAFVTLSVLMIFGSVLYWAVEGDTYPTWITLGQQDEGRRFLKEISMPEAIAKQIQNQTDIWRSGLSLHNLTPPDVGHISHTHMPKRIYHTLFTEVTSATTDYTDPHYPDFAVLYG